MRVDLIELPEGLGVLNVFIEYSSRRSAKLLAKRFYALSEQEREFYALANSSERCCCRYSHTLKAA
jgi:hypothetical protein